MKAGEVRVGALRDVEHLGTAEAGHLGDKILFIYSEYHSYLKPLHSRVAVEETCVGKINRITFFQDLCHQFCPLWVPQKVIFGL